MTFLFKLYSSFLCKCHLCCSTSYSKNDIPDTLNMVWLWRGSHMQKKENMHGRPHKHPYQTPNPSMQPSWPRKVGMCMCLPPWVIPGYMPTTWGGGMSCQGNPLANHLGPILMWTRASSPQPWHSGCAGLWVGAHWNLKAPFKNKGVSYHPPAHEWSRSM